MSFLDKFFNQKNRSSKVENAIKTETDSLSFKSSHLSISKNHIRFVLFRECDRRGRKLLFDSNAVEKLSLSSRSAQKQSSEKIIDFIETTNTHGYKYKKPSSDVTCLGEMIFGSVAMVHRGESSSKIHCIPSPKQLMFTTIVHAPVRCFFNSSECSTGVNSKASSLVSFNEFMIQKPTSSSDSKLYGKQCTPQKHSSTYPWIKKECSLLNKITQCCEISELDKNKFMQSDCELKCLGNLCTSSSQSCGFNLTQEDKSSSQKIRSQISYSEKDSNIGSSVVTSVESEYVSSGSSSLSSLRRRWVQSHATSLESITYEDINCSPYKKKTKLGMAIVLDLSDATEKDHHQWIVSNYPMMMPTVMMAEKVKRLERQIMLHGGLIIKASVSKNINDIRENLKSKVEMEKFLFNHTIVIDGIMAKLQSSVELAYVRNENFVDLIYTAFQESQESIHELVTSGKYETPMWYSLAGNPDDFFGIPFVSKSHCESGLRVIKQQDLLESVQLKFLNDFCDVLIKFDTKDTNFFISTLLTAVLTHHLSWVTSIAGTDSITSNQDLSVIKSTRPYNPIWAQLSDLCGLMGSPLKCAKTIVSGPESKKRHIGDIIQVLTYFIRCHDVVENVYDVNIEEIIRNADFEGKKVLESIDFESIESDEPNTSIADTKLGRNFFNSPVQIKVQSENIECFPKIEKDILLRGENLVVRECRLKQSKSYLSFLEVQNTLRSEKMYVDLTKSVRESDRTDSTESVNMNEIIRIPKKNISVHLEGYLSPDEGYDTIDSLKTNSVQMEKVRLKKTLEPAFDEKKEGIVFTLGDSENVVVTKSSIIDMEREEPEDSFESEKKVRTCHSLSVKNEKSEHSHAVSEPKKSSCRVPWMLRQINMPKVVTPSRRRRLEVSSVLGGVNQKYNSEQIIQGVTDPMSEWEEALHKDLFLSAHNSVLEKNINEALCIVGDMNSWEVSLLSSNTSILNKNKEKVFNVGMSQLVADMLESFLYLHTINLSPAFCLLHIEKKLHEIYSKSKTVAEILDSTELCSIDYLTARLDIGINDVPLLLSVATTHSPHISHKYGLSFT